MSALGLDAYVAWRSHSFKVEFCTAAIGTVGMVCPSFINLMAIALRVVWWGHCMNIGQCTRGEQSPTKQVRGTAVHQSGLTIWQWALRFAHFGWSIPSWPVNGETWEWVIPWLASCRQLSMHHCLKACRNEESAAIIFYYNVINDKMVFDGPKFLQWIWQGRLPIYTAKRICYLRFA
jgi:hypothetical protein